MMQESAFDKNAISYCGAAGIMQLMPGTARDNGLTNIFENANFVSCDNSGYADRLRNTISSTDPQNVDDRFKPGPSISAGINYIYTLFQQMASYTTDKQNLIKLVVASYNAGPGTVISAMQGNSDYDSFKSRLPQQTQDYVVAVLGYYTQYGGSVTNSEGLYYYHQDSANKFYSRSFSMEQKGEDFLPAIDCREEGSPYGLFDAGNPVTYNGIIRAHHWDSDQDTGVICFCGQLWSCNVIVQKLPKERSLETGDNVLPPSIGCDQALIFLGASRIVCTANGFGTV